MRQTQEQFLRYLRIVLGTQMRRSDDRLDPLRLHFEQGYRWEDEETLEAMIAADDLRDVADRVLVRLEEFVERYKKSLTDAEKRWLSGLPKKKGQGAIGALKKGVQFLSQIKRAEMLEREEAWVEGELEDVSEGHEMYFMRRYAGAIRMLRLAWNAMFYATQKPSVRRVKMTEKESRGFHDYMSPGVRKKVMGEADAISEQTGRYVEVYDDDGDLVYVAQPPSTLSKAQQKIASRSARARTKIEEAWTWRPKGEKTQPAMVIAEMSPEQGEQVRQLIASRPGMTIREAAEQIGAEVAPAEPMKENPRPMNTDDDAAVDQILMAELWEMPY